MINSILSLPRCLRLANAPARIVAALLRGIVATASFDAAGLGHAYAQIVAARSRRWRRFLAAHAADSGNIAVIATLASHRALSFR